MKKIAVLLVLITTIAFSASNEDCPCADNAKPTKHSSFDYHFGGGYSAIFLQNDVNFPLGFMVYAGLGYRFNRVFSVGAEYEFEYAKTFDSRVKDAYALGNLPKAYLKFKVADIFAFTTTLGAGLYGYEFIRVADSAEYSDDYNSFMLGLRATLFFAYAQVNITNDFVQMGAGFSFSM